VRVSLGTRNGRLHLSISDAGRGFDVEQLKTKGLGLIGMEERVRQVGGTFTITSKGGEGTRIDIEIPPALAE
jgi:signal transduction histidine kinase